MSDTLETIVSATCTHYEPLPAMGNKTGFSIPDAKQARLAFDVFMAHGFDANLYTDNGISRLYIRTPSARLMALLPRLLIYARSLQTIKETMDGLLANKASQTSDYSINFAGAGHGKQITIHLAAVLPDSDAAATAAAVSQPPKKATSRPQQASDDFSDDFFAGPQIMRPRGIRQKQTYTNAPDGYGKQLKNYIKGNSAGAVMLAIVGIFGLVFLFSLFQVSKGFFCPDFVVAKEEKNQEWYCK